MSTSADFFADAGGDGFVRRYTSGTWAATVSASSGDDNGASSTGDHAVYHDIANPMIYRAFFPFDTSSIPDTATIVSATLNLWCTAKTSTGGGSFAVVASTQTSSTALVNGDYSKVGSTEFSSRVNFSTPTTGAYYAIPLNASGIAAINLTGFTKLALRSAADLDNSAPAGTSNFQTKYSDNTGTSNDPYLTVVYDIFVSKTYTADAIIKATSTATYTADAVINPDRFCDTFADTAGTNLQSHTPSGSTYGASGYGTWTQWYTAGGFDRLKITSGGDKLYAYTSAAIPTTSVYRHSLQFTDASYSADFSIPGSHNDGGYGQLGLRVAGADPASWTNYDVIFTNGGTGTAGTLIAQKDVSGSASTLGTYTIGTLSNASTYRVTLVVSGSSISVKLNGVTVLGPYTDTGVTAKGYVDLTLNTPNGASQSVGVQVDNLVVEPAPTATTKTYTADAIVDPTHPTKTYTADAIIFGTSTKTYSADAIVGNPQVTKTYTADAVINGTSFRLATSTRSSYGSQVTIESPGTLGTADSWHGGASLVHIPDGTTNGRLIVSWLNWVGQPFTYNPTPAGWDDGIWCSESTDLGATWGTPYQAVSGLTAPDKSCIAHMSYDPIRDKLLLVYYDIVYRGTAPGHSTPYDGALNANRCHYRECASASTGARTWSSDRILDGHTGFTDSDVGGSTYGEAAPHNLIVLSDGTYLLSLYGRDHLSDSYNLTYSRLMRSTDGGANWTALGRIALNSATLNVMNAEPAVVKLDTGRILCVMRVQEAVASSGVNTYMSCYSDDNGSTWSTPVNLGFTLYGGANMPHLYQTVSGDVLLATNPPSSYGVCVHQSNDRGVTWTTAATFVPTDGGAYLGAMFAEATTTEGDGNVLVAWCEEQAGGPGTTGLWGDPAGPYTVGGQAIIRGWTKFGKLSTVTSTISYVQRTATYTADAIVSASGSSSQTKTYTADAVIYAPPYSVSYTADGIVKGLGLTKTYTADGFVDSAAGGATRALSWFFRHRRSSMTQQSKTYTVVQAKGTTRTATWTSPTYKAETEAGILVVLDVTAASGTGGLTLRINAHDLAGSVEVPLNSSPTVVTTTGTTSYSVYPFGAISGALTQSTSGYLPRQFSITVTHADSSSYTYSVGFCLLP